MKFVLAVCLVLVAVASADFSVHAEEQDRYSQGLEYLWTKYFFAGHFVQFPPTMPVQLLAMEGPVLRPASPPVEYSPGLSTICAVLWQLLHAQLLQQLLLLPLHQQLPQLLSRSRWKTEI